MGRMTLLDCPTPGSSAVGLCCTLFGTCCTWSTGCGVVDCVAWSRWSACPLHHDDGWV